MYYAAMRIDLMLRLKAALACLRGCPVAYKISVSGGLRIPHNSTNTLIIQCSFYGQKVALDAY